MMAVTGLDEIERALKGLKPEELSSPLFMELLACPGGCVNGPQTTPGGPTALRRLNLLEYAMRARDSLGESRPEMSGTLPVQLSTPVIHSDEEMAVALRQVGKNTIQDELNCGSCGYDTCRSFVAAMLEHHAEKNDVRFVHAQACAEKSERAYQGDALRSRYLRFEFAHHRM